MKDNINGKVELKMGIGLEYYCEQVKAFEEERNRLFELCYSKNLFHYLKRKNCKEKIAKLIDLNINTDLDHEVFITKNDELNQELIQLEENKNEILNSKIYIQKEEKRLKTIEKELSNTRTTYKFDDVVFKKLISKVIMGDYDDEGNYNPNVVKFVLNLKNISSNDSMKFLSLEVDERLY